MIKPGGDPSQLSLGFVGHDSLKIDIMGALKVYMRDKFIKLEHAIAYQVGYLGNVIPLGWYADFQFEESSGSVNFVIDGQAYNPSLPLVLQVGPPPFGPEEASGVCWSTYFGGDREEVPSGGLESSKNGTLYLSGYTKSSELTFPAVIGVNAFTAWSVAFLSQFDPQHDLMWSSYYGGNYHTYAHGLTIKPYNNAITEKVYVVGSTQATELFIFPQDGAYNSSNGPADVGTPMYFRGFIAKFDYFGNVVWSTYFGEEGSPGSDVLIYGADTRMIGGREELVIVGVHSMGLPVPSEPPPSSYTVYPSDNGDDNSDGYLALFDENDRLFWTTTIGGTLDDRIIDVAVSQGRIVVAGITLSDDIPTVELQGGYYDGEYNGAGDMIIWEFTASGTHIWGTYFGGTGIEAAGDLGGFPWEGATNPLGVAASGDIYVVGRTGSADLPLANTGGLFVSNPSRCFATRFGSSRQLKWSSYLETFNVASVLPVANARVLIGASTRQPGEFPVVSYGSLYHQPDPFQNAGLDNNFYDAAVILLDDLEAVVWSTHFGGISASNIQERIYAWASNDTEYLCAGMHCKPWNNMTTYFPLKSDGYYDWTYNDMGYGDVFISAFCHTNMVSVEDNSLARGSLELQFLGEGHYRVLNGGEEVMVWNSIGQCVLAQHSDPKTQREISLHDFPSGVYIVSSGGQFAKLMHQR